ncbi:MAG TPA: arginine deiminase-related protein [Candidatus Binataceae bacterium]|jgi:N-dimethylarginine dimethylaminohydrolase|nr:arginine deiminase-related protein [Candidatus Binataceae bacterium]
MPRTILMGDPTFFSVLGGANPHTRNALGLKKSVNPDLARRQWHGLARALIGRGTEVCVIEPHEGLSGLVYPANAGFLYPLSGAPSEAKTFHLAHLLPTRAREREVYRRFLERMGYRCANVAARFEGEADFFPAGRFMLFTYGRIERQRFVPRIGIPPWRRIYGFRSEYAALDELSQIAGERPILALELCREAHYHGDTVLCSFGPQREFLLAYIEGLAPASRERLRAEFSANLIELSQRDAELYAANSFQVDYEGRLYLFMPQGVSEALAARVRERGVEPIMVDVSEFLAKGGGSVKCMILDLGPSEEQPNDPAAVEFRSERSYERLFAD